MDASTSVKCGNAECPNPPDNTTKLLLCGRCKEVSYCSKNCQEATWPTHKTLCQRQNYIIEFQLHPDDIQNPTVSRTLSCPADATFQKLHLALQGAFGWGRAHCFDFAVLDPSYKAPTDMAESMRRMMSTITDSGDGDLESREYLLRVVDPQRGTPKYPLDQVHEHLRKHPETEEKMANALRLWQVFDNSAYRDNKMVYVYDFGDNWEHWVTIKGRTKPTTHFECLDGSGHAAAEDVGSKTGWEDLKEAYRTKKPTKEQKERRDWYESNCPNGDWQGLGGDRLNIWNQEDINKYLATL